MTPLTRTTTPVPWPGWSRVRAEADPHRIGSGGSCSIRFVTPSDEDLLVSAPDIVAVYDALEEGRPIELRRDLRRRAGPGSALRTAAQLDAIAAAIASLVRDLPDGVLREPGGEADWNVAQTVGHVADSRAGLALAASLAATGRFPANAPAVVPGVPGAVDASRDAVLRRLESSRRIVTRAARSIAGHESDPCPLEHPLVGRLRCGEWLLFAGVHDLMHVAQLRAIAAARLPEVTA